jgi:hypothetical protein
MQYSLRCRLNVHWLCTECSLNVPWTFPVLVIVAWVVLVGSFYFPKSRLQNSFRRRLNVHWMFTRCSLEVHWMFTECSLNVHRMFPERSLNVHWASPEDRDPLEFASHQKAIEFSMQNKNSLLDKRVLVSLLMNGGNKSGLQNLWNPAAYVPHTYVYFPTNMHPLCTPNSLLRVYLFNQFCNALVPEEKRAEQRSSHIWHHLRWTRTHTQP